MDMRLLMKQAQKMQENLQREIAELKVESSVGGGMRNFCWTIMRATATTGSRLKKGPR